MKTFALIFISLAIVSSMTSYKVNGARTINGKCPKRQKYNDETTPDVVKDTAVGYHKLMKMDKLYMKLRDSDEAEAEAVRCVRMKLSESEYGFSYIDVDGNAVKLTGSWNYRLKDVGVGIDLEDGFELMPMGGDSSNSLRLHIRDIMDGEIILSRCTDNGRSGRGTPRTKTITTYFMSTDDSEIDLDQACIDYSFDRFDIDANNMTKVDMEECASLYANSPQGSDQL